MSAMGRCLGVLADGDLCTLYACRRFEGEEKLSKNMREVCGYLSALDVVSCRGGHNCRLRWWGSRDCRAEVRIKTRSPVVWALSLQKVGGL